jgi:hypothetical protein
VRTDGTCIQDDTGVHLWDDTICTVGATDKREAESHHVHMPGITPDSDTRAPTLTVRRLQGEGRGARHELGAARHDGRRGAVSLAEDGPSVLIAGADAARRNVLLEELVETLPEGTTFGQASTFSEVLEHAPMSRIVVLSGGLDDAPVRSLVRVLGQRHPALPVITVDASGPHGL